MGLSPFNFILILAINSKNNLWAAKRCSSDIHRGFYFVLVICFVFFFSNRNIVDLKSRSFKMKSSKCSQILHLQTGFAVIILCCFQASALRKFLAVFP